MIRIMMGLIIMFLVSPMNVHAGCGDDAETECITVTGQSPLPTGGTTILVNGGGPGGGAGEGPGGTGPGNNENDQESEGDGNNDTRESESQCMTRASNFKTVCLGAIGAEATYSLGVYCPKIKNERYKLICKSAASGINLMSAGMCLMITSDMEQRCISP